MTSIQIPGTAYDTDFMQWIDRTAELLRERKFDQLDIENLIEEVESLGRREKNALKSNLRILLIHLLKWQYQSHKRTSSWISTIAEHRNRIQDSLEDSPRLKNYCQEVFQKSYIAARKQASRETGLDIDTFPVVCPYTVNQVLDSDFWPE